MKIKGVMVLALIAVLTMVTVVSVTAEPVTADTAKMLVNAWLNAEAKTGYSAESAEPVLNEDGAVLHYIVKCTPKGYVVVAGDTRIEPVIAFSEAPNVRDGNPLLDVVLRDTASRYKLIESAEILRATIDAKKATAADSPVAVDTSTEEALLTTLATIEQEASDKWTAIMSTASTRKSSSDPYASIRPTRTVVEYSAPVQQPSENFAPAGLTVWVDPIISTSWDQNKQYGSFGSNLYNLMTPSNRLAGCGPVALAQVMFYHSWPMGSELNGSSADAVVQLSNGTYVTNTYNFIATYTNVDSLASITNMLNEYKGTSESIAWTNVSALMADIGVAAGATYYTNQTGTTMQNLHTAMTNVFKYPRAVYGDSSSNMASILNLNIIGKKPVVMAFYNSAAPTAGHIAVVDGYAVSAQNTTFHHLNLGWGEVGENTAWYNLPSIIAYDTIAGYIHNIMTNGQELIVGRIVSSATNPIANVTVSIEGGATIASDAYGTFGLEVDSGAVSTVTVSKVGYVTQSYVVTNGTSSGNTSGNRYRSTTLAKGPDMSFTAKTYANKIVLNWSDPTNSYYPGDIRIIATTNSGGSEAAYSTFWTNAAMSTEWFTNWNDLVENAPGTTDMDTVAFPTNLIFSGDGSATTSLTISNMPLNITYYFKMWCSNATGFVEIENGTSTAYTTPDANSEVFYFAETSGLGRAYFMMPNNQQQTSGTYQWKYDGWCADSNMLSYNLAGSEDFNGDSIPDIVWQSRTNCVDQNDNYLLWEMNLDGTLSRQISMEAPVNIVSGWTVKSVVDLDADSHPDLLMGNSTDGRMITYYMTNGVYTAISPVISNTVPLNITFKALGTR